MVSGEAFKQIIEQGYLEQAQLRNGGDITARALLNWIQDNPLVLTMSQMEETLDYLDVYTKDFGDPAEDFEDLVPCG